MKISTKGRYGLRAMVDLAYHSKDEYVPLSIIAKRQQISEKYMEQVFSLLKKAGLVNSSKGVQGGYRLSNKPEDVAIEDILNILEGDLSIVPRKTHSSNKETVKEDLMDNYLHNQIWSKVDAEINKIVCTISLQDLIDDFKEKSKML